ncbi:hypothetical protein ABZ863_15205 [Saccharomonospora sp. NPDC046836]|uniref:hypothetical protein n=1 Tax=Saccharomonospora sp. NPDC046836 TaxID=3156921 RepID=UPI0033C192AF
MANEDGLDRLLRAWRDDIDSEPFPAIVDVVLPRQLRRHLRDDVGHSRPASSATRGSPANREH